MPTQVHLNIDDKLMDEIRALAAQERRTITQQCNLLLEQALADRARTARHAKAIAGKA